ncbi:MAG TPA: 16S rRNA (uracil(1498)-N(3))-methyltransferase [Bacillota bacterium]|nr:16S rRNA (uracil(1498)-N(3))-methyltransferase [Bacillota bacterium]
MQRYFIPETNWSEKSVQISGDDAHHIQRVMRFEVGDKLICNHPDGRVALCTIAELSKQTVEATIDRWINEQRELPVQVTIAQGLAKGDKFEWVLQKGTELGAHAFIPYQAERSVVKWNRKKAEKKQQRFERIVKEASEQCHRNKIPTIAPVMTLAELIEKSTNYDVKIFAYEQQVERKHDSSFASVIQRLEKDQNVLVCIGPEGGFSENEATILTDHGFIPVRLGPRILRTETAPLYVLASISYHVEELQQ